VVLAAFQALTWSSRILSKKGRSNKNFLGFYVKRFSRGLNESHEVVLVGLESASESKLSAADSKADSRDAIRRIHSMPSIFHLFKKELCQIS
jgi:hypothetical protein